MKLVLAALVGLLIAAPAFSNDELVTIDGKNIKVTGVSGSDDPKLNSSVLNNGVFVKSGQGVGYPNIVRMIKERLAMRGIKVNDTMEGSSYSFWVGIDKGIPMDAAEKSLAYSSTPDGVKAAGMVGQAAVFTKNLGQNGLIGYMAGAIWDEFADKKIVLRVNAMEKPIMEKGWFNTVGMASSTGNWNMKLATVSYSLEKGKEAGDDVVLKMAVDKWIDTFIVFDTPPTITPVTIDTTPGKTDSTDVQISMNAISGVIPADSMEQK